MHVFEWIQWGSMQLLFDVLRWLPDMHPYCLLQKR